MRGSVKALVVCGALITSGLGAAAPAAAGTAVPSCSVTFEGTVSGQWSNPANWSTGQVPGPDSDVCITKPLPPEDSPIATGTIDIRSLHVGAGTGVALGGEGPTVPVRDASVTISGVLTDTSDSYVLLDGTLRASAIDNPGVILAGAGPCTKPPRVVCRDSTITSPALSSTGTISANNGNVRLTDDPLQLNDGTLTGGTLEVWGGALGDAMILDGGISSIAAGTIDLESGNIENQSGGNALASLSLIGPNATLLDESTLTVNGNLTAHGTLEVLGDPGALDVHGNLVADGPFVAEGVEVAGDYTQASAATLADNFGVTGMSVGKTATLSGTLETGVRKTCTPEDGTTATVLTFAARDGTFTTTPSGFNVLYGATSVQVQYEGPVNRTGCGGGGRNAADYVQVPRMR
jgi:hypothetical protein